jgi:glycosyltransferase involved in cell wall biosynthesis
VICGNGGGMAESVRNGVDGLHFPIGDSAALAATMERAITTPRLWDRLVANIRPPRRMADCAAEHLALYRRLLARPRAEPAAWEPSDVGHG